MAKHRNEKPRRAPAASARKPRAAADEKRKPKRILSGAEKNYRDMVASEPREGE
jgi:hypothetical protein